MTCDKEKLSSKLYQTEKKEREKRRRKRGRKKRRRRKSREKRMKNDNPEKKGKNDRVWALKLPSLPLQKTL